MDNQEMINKGVITTSDISSNGKLSPDQSNAFIDLVFEQAKLKNVVTTVKFNNHQKNFDKLAIDERVVFPRDENQHTGFYSGMNTSGVEIKPFRYMATVAITDEVRDYNIARKNLDNFLLQQFTKRIADNLETYMLYADTNAPTASAKLFDPVNGDAAKRVKDVLLAKGDGILKQAQSAHVVDGLNNHKMDEILLEAINALPDQYKTNISALRAFMPTSLLFNYNYQTSQRQTVYGDATAKNIEALQGFGGINLLTLPLMSVNGLKVKNVTLTGTTAVSLGYKNIKASDVIVTSTTIGLTAETPKVLTTDYVIDEAKGTIARVALGGITDGETVKVTFKGSGELILTNPANIVIGMNTDDMRIESERIPSAQKVVYYISGSMDVKILETDALVLVKNIKNSYK